jgi:hypothetical protein
MAELPLMRFLLSIPVVAALAGLVLVVAASATGDGGDGLDAPAVPSPSEFTTRIDNPYWPMSPGTRWVFRETDVEGNEQRVVVEVTRRTRAVMGIEARVVHDRVTEHGRIVEDTYDWYAQDSDGNVWYLGEDTKEFEEGKVVSTAGSWEAGVDGAHPGIAMPAEPEVGMSYRQELYAGKAEDAASVLSVEERAETPAGSFDDVLMTKDFTPLEPDVLEYKFYARGVGPIAALGVSGGIGREELVALRRS